MGVAGDQTAVLRRLLAITRDMAGTTDFDTLLRTIVEATCEVLDCERATVFLYDAETNEFHSRVATDADDIRFSADRGIAGAAARERGVINVPDAYADERFNREVDRATGFRTRNLLTFPLENLAGELMGVLQALNKRGGSFDETDEELARVLSAQAGVAVHRQRLLDEYAQKQRMARDLELARRIQQAALPKRNPTIAGYDVAGWNRSADETGGDCYDFVELDDDRLGIVLADATGHGIHAALVIAQCRSLTRGLLAITPSLSDVAHQVNDVLQHDLTDDRFVTALIGVLDPQAHRLDYVAAGQGPLLLLAPDGVERRNASGMPFGIVEDFDGEAPRFTFAPGALLVLLTDGFYEAANPAGEEFGEQRVVDVVRANIDNSLDTLIETLHDEIRRFTEGAPQHDDLTAVLIRRHPDSAS